MTIQIEYGTENIDWSELCDLIRISPLGTRDPLRLKVATELRRERANVELHDYMAFPMNIILRG